MNDHSKSFLISVHICTYNPRADHILRTIEGLKAQTLSRDKWELLLVDNASTTDTAAKADLAWHPHGTRHHVAQVGKTNALLFAIHNAKAPLLLTVDDDNVLAPDYLERCLEIASGYLKIGTFGGQIVPEYEVSPRQWAARHVVNLSVYETDRDIWSNLPCAEFFPPGAGMCFRKEVGLRYARLVDKDPLRAKLDRQGELMVGCGDTDLAFCSIDLGMGNGRFKDLKLTHLIPKERTSDEGLLDLIERTAYSFVVLHSIRPESTPADRSIPMAGWRKKWHSRLERLARKFLPRDERLAQDAAWRGVKKANNYLSQLAVSNDHIR
jgi:glycosyltransferase involved in cell wall biosynthesis